MKSKAFNFFVIALFLLLTNLAITYLPQVVNPISGWKWLKLIGALATPPAVILAIASLITGAKRIKRGEDGKTLNRIAIIGSSLILIIRILLVVIGWRK